MIKSAERSLINGDFDIAAFTADQAVQLYLKSVILELSGEMPRVHVVRQLMYILKELLNKRSAVDKSVRENKAYLLGLRKHT